MPGSGAKTLRVKLVNTASSGTCYWHQVEALSNIYSNPSLENWQGTSPDIPSSFSNMGLDAGDTAQSTSVVHSGAKAFQANTTATTGERLYNITGFLTGKFYSIGHFSYGDGAKGFYFTNDSINAHLQYSTSALTFKSNVLSQWKPTLTVWRSARDSGQAWKYFDWESGATGLRYLDDLYWFQLSDVSLLTVTPATLANSTESTGIRVDGRDTYTQTVSGLTSTAGSFGVNYTPRHSAGDVAKFGVSTPYIFDIYGNSTNYIRAYWSAANVITLAFNDGGTERYANWDATGVIVAGTTYSTKVTYSPTSAILSVDGVDKATAGAGTPPSFATVPTTLYMGSKNDGTLQGDATFASYNFGPTGSVSINSAAASVGSSSVTLTLSGSDDNSSEANLDIKVSNLSDLSDASWEDFSASKAWTINTSGGDGVKTVYYLLKDESSLESATFSDTIIYDTTNPTAPGTPSTTSPTSDKTPTWTWDASTDAGSGLHATTPYTVEWANDSSFTNETGTTTSSSTSYTHTSNLHDGTWYFRVKAMDALSHESSYSSSGSVVIETGSPSNTSISINDGDAYSISQAVTLTLNAEDTNTPIEIRVANSRSGVTGSSWETYDSSTSHSLTATDGSKTVYAQFRDSLENETDIISDSITLDTTDPTGVGIPSTSSASNDNTPTWVWTGGSDATSGLSTTASYTLEWSQSAAFSSTTGSSTVGTNSCSGGSCSFTHTTALDDATWYFRVKATDNAENETAYYTSDSFLISTDGDPPTGSVSIDGGNSYTQDGSVALTISATDNVDAVGSLQMKVGNTASLDSASWETYSTSKTHTLDTTSEGTKTVYIKFKDSKANESQVYSDTIVYDAAAPTEPDLADPDDGSFTNDATPKFNWDASTDSVSGVSSYDLYVKKSGDDYANKGDTDSDTTEYTLKDSQELESEGTYYWYVQVSYNAGNTRDSSTYSFTLDKTKPTISLLENWGSVGDPVKTSDTAFVIKGEAADDKEYSYLHVKVDSITTLLGAVIGYAKLLEGNVNLTEEAWQYTYGGDLAYGNYRFTFSVFDSAGNESSKAYAYVNLITKAQEEALKREEAGEGLTKLAEDLKNTVDNIGISPEEKQEIVERVQEYRLKQSGNLAELAEKPFKTYTRFDRFVEEQIGVLDGLAVFLKDSGTFKAQEMALGLHQLSQQLVQIIQGSTNVISSAVQTTSAMLGAGSNLLANTLGKASLDAQDAIANTIFTKNFIVIGVSNTAKDLSGKSTVLVRTSSANMQNTFDSITQSQAVKSARFAGESFIAKYKTTKEFIASVWFETEPTRIYDVKITQVGANHAMISWKTNHPAKSKINYGTSTSYGQEKHANDYTTNHAYTLDNLNMGTKYYFEVMNWNKVYVFDAYYTFDTLN